jgi:hypothetical protein
MQYLAGGGCCLAFYAIWVVALQSGVSAGKIGVIFGMVKLAATHYYRIGKPLLGGHRQNGYSRMVSNHSEISYVKHGYCG